MQARIELTPEEKESFMEDINDILDSLEELKALETAQIPPTVHGLENCNVFREDVVIPGLDRDKAFQNAPEHQDGFFSVPRIL